MTPFDYGSLGSQTTFNAGRAAPLAAPHPPHPPSVELAAEALDCPVESVVLRRRLRWEGDDRAAPLDPAAPRDSGRGRSIPPRAARSALLLLGREGAMPTRARPPPARPPTART